MFGKNKSREVVYNPKEYLDIFTAHINDNKSYIYYSEIYSEVKSKYEEKIGKKEIDIKVERVRLQSQNRSKKKDKAYIFDLCLQVIDDLEKEMKDENRKIMITNEEVAATIEAQTKEQAKHISNQNNGNWNVSISETSILSMAKDLYKTAKLVRKMFNKRK